MNFRGNCQAREAGGTPHPPSPVDMLILNNLVRFQFTFIGYPTMFRKTKVLIENTRPFWHSILLRTKDSVWRQLHAFKRLSYDVIHGIGLKLGFVFRPFSIPLKREALFSLASKQRTPTLRCLTKQMKLIDFRRARASRYPDHIAPNPPFQGAYPMILQIPKLLMDRLRLRFGGRWGTRSS